MAAASVDSSLWWDPFTDLLTELEDAPISSDISPNLMKKLQENHAWFLDLVSLFKPPTPKSKEALNSEIVNVGSHQLTVRLRLKDAALQISSTLCLDEVQSYILVNRLTKQLDLESDFSEQDLLHSVLLQYYIDRQCLLKCTRQIITLSLHNGAGSKEASTMRGEVLRLVSEGVEDKLLYVLQNLLSPSHPEQLGVDLFTLWAEEVLIEVNLVLEILFFVYYESFSSCSSEKWRKLCSLYKGIIFGSSDFGKLAVSDEAMQSSYHVKVQLLLILMETLDLDSLLQMLHDEMPLRQSSFVYSMTDIQEMDTIVSSLNAFATKEAGPLVLTWAVFLCLISSLPGKEENSVLVEIDHISYVRQAFEAASLSYFLEILESNTMKDIEGPVAGYRSVMRTFISAFIASYEINLELEDATFKLILDVLRKIYRGEESLCVQFWDKDSFIDEPIRCLLATLEVEFPMRIVEFVRFLSALCEGSWPSECVFNYLDKSVGVSSSFEIGNNSFVDSLSQVVVTHSPLNVPGAEGLIIPTRTHGRVVRMLDENIALVRWEYTQSGVFILLLRLAQEQYVCGKEEVLVTLDLFCRLLSFNTAVCFSLMNLSNSLQIQKTDYEPRETLRIDVVEVVCMLIRNLLQNCSGSTVMVAMAINILVKMLTCFPSHVAGVVLKADIFELSSKCSSFDVHCNISPSGSWLLSGRLAKLLLIDCEQNDGCCPLTIAVSEFTMHVLDKGIEHDVVLALIVFCLQYVFVNHQYWNYRAKHVRWNVTLKVLEVIKKCIASINYSQKYGEVIRDIIISDSSIHSTMFRIICTTAEALEKLYVSRIYDLMEIEGLKLSLRSALDIVFLMLSSLPVDLSSGFPVFHQALLSPSTKPLPVVTAMMSLISYSRDPAIQVGAARILSMLFMLADCSQQYLFCNPCSKEDDEQVKELRNLFAKILYDHPLINEDLFVAIFKLFTSAACHQPAFLVSVFSPKVGVDVEQKSSSSLKPAVVKDSFEKASPLYSIQQFLEKSDGLMKSEPHMLLIVLNFLKVLWQGAPQYKEVLLLLRNSEKFWKHLTSILSNACKEPAFEEINGKDTLDLTYRYRCQSVSLEIVMYEKFYSNRLQHAQSLVKRTAESSKERPDIPASNENSGSSDVVNLKKIFSSWCESSILGDLIMSIASCNYDTDLSHRVEISVSLFMVHVMGMLTAGDTGCLSVLLVNKTCIILEKLSVLPSFTNLKAQYSRHGYSEGDALTGLILSDLYYHLEGELEGRKIDVGPFKELSHYLLDSKLFHSYIQKYDGDAFEHSKDVYLFDLTRLRADFGLDICDRPEWKSYKVVANTLLCFMQQSNSRALISSSKLSALRALVNMLLVFKEDLSVESNDSVLEAFEKLSPFCINNICRCFSDTIESLAPELDASDEIVSFLAGQVDLLCHLVRITKKLPLSTCISVLKTSGSGLKVLTGIRSSVSRVTETVKLLLLLVLSSTESFCVRSLVGEPDIEPLKLIAEMSNVSLGILPILCNSVERADYLTISLSCIDLIIKSFSTPNTWFPIVQKYLPIKSIVLTLQDKQIHSSIPIIFKFLLTIARVKEGAEMLLGGGLFQSLKVVFSDLPEGTTFMEIQIGSASATSDKVERPVYTWGLGLAVITAIIHSLGDGSCNFMIDHVIPYIFSEKSQLISYYLTAPDFPSDNHDRKRARVQRAQTSLSALKETEYTLMLICTLAKHQDPWLKAMQEADSQLRERSIHFLAFINRGVQHQRESPSRMAPLLCPPVLKEEIRGHSEPSLIDCRNGWFGLSPLGCVSKLCPTSVSTRAVAILWKDQVAENINTETQTYFSDTVAVQIYKIAFLILKFLCLQAEGAVQRAEEVGFVDLAHFPELPVPEILHGLQDQAVAIVTELCDDNKSTTVISRPENQRVCLLLVQVLEMALYLELCVSQMCGLRPVLGRIEDFSRHIKLMFRVSEKHGFLRKAMDSSRQIISYMYPGLLETGPLSLDAPRQEN